MNAKKWIRTWFIIISTLPIIGGFNYIIDPLWTVNSSNKYNNVQKGFNERQQKTNYIYNRKLKNYNGILLGSSRATYINQNEFANMNIYNYASSGILPYEYKGYLDFAKEIKGKDFEYIIIGSDFYGTNNIKLSEPSTYVNNAISSIYKYKMLFSIDTIKNSFINIKNSFNGAKIYYDRDNIKYRSKISEIERKMKYTESLKRHTLDLSDPTYSYNNNYINILKQLKKENPNTKFIIFTSAITSDLLVSIIKNAKRINEFERWLRELIEVFGSINHFMTINSITQNLQNYPDDDHAYPNVVKFIANKVSNHKNNNIPKDFGIILDKDNIDIYLEKFKIQIEEYKIPKI